MSLFKEFCEEGMLRWFYILFNNMVWVEVSYFVQKEIQCIVNNNQEVIVCYYNEECLLREDLFGKLKVKFKIYEIF